METIRISVRQQDRTIDFAARELAAYLQRMGNDALVRADGGICLGLDAARLSHLDDRYTISIEQGRGEILGSNPRSVLFGVYRYLRACGCAFLFPGPHGEIIPAKADVIDFSCEEAASNRYRCMSIEGACSRENVLDMIAWLPKVGMNSYHFQLLDGYGFFDRWYSHARNPHKAAVPITKEQTAGYIREAVDCAKERGLLVQYMGHGWTSEPFGIQAEGWERKEFDLPEETLSMLAMVNGRRQVWKNIPIDTNACYSNPTVREKMVETIAQFAKDHPETDLLHVWLGDDMNNYCECDACREKIPSDWYVMLLNELDAALAAAGIDTKVVFLVFSELLWAPEHETFTNPDRFVLIFAPVSQKYTGPFETAAQPASTKPFVLNDIRLPRTDPESLAYLRQWQEIFHGDSFVYIYHLLSSGWEKDISMLRLAKIMYTDVHTYARLGCKGTSSCQTQRCAFPLGLVQYVMARALWDSSAAYATLQEEYFSAAYGENSALALTFLRQIQAFFPPEYLQGREARTSERAAERFAAVQPYMEEMAQKLHAAGASLDDARAYQWTMLERTAQLLARLGPIFHAIAQGERPSKLRAPWEDFVAYLYSFEDELQSVFDMDWFVRNFELFEIRGLTSFVNDAPAWDDGE